MKVYYFENDVETWGPRNLPNADKWRSGLHNADPAELIGYDVHGDGSLIVDYRPQIAVGENDPYDSKTQVREQTGHVVTATDVTDTWTVRAMTQQELDDRAAEDDADLDIDVDEAVDSVLGKAQFALKNEVNVLAGNPVMTTPEYTAWLKAQQ